MPPTTKKSPEEPTAKAPEPAASDEAAAPDDLAQIKAAVLNLAKTVTASQSAIEERLSALETAPASQPAKAPPPEGPTLPEGVVRFRTTHKELRCRQRRDKKLVVDGIVISEEPKWITFRGGLYDTSDPEEIEFLKSRSYFGRTLFIDPGARPHKGVKVTDGPRSMGRTVRDPERSLAVKL